MFVAHRLYDHLCNTLQDITRVMEISDGRPRQGAWQHDRFDEPVMRQKAKGGGGGEPHTAARRREVIVFVLMGEHGRLCQEHVHFVVDAGTTTM